VNFRQLCENCDRLRQLGLHPLSDVVVSNGTADGDLPIHLITLDRGRVMIHPDFSDDVDAVVREAAEERE
jgi:hypothetical protein